MAKPGYVYILTNKWQTVLYVGVTGDLKKRVWEHKQKVVSGFTTKYTVDRLVYYEVADDISAAIEREKQLKAGPRRKKIQCIDRGNPEWKDLYDDLG